GRRRSAEPGAGTNRKRRGSGRRPPGPAASRRSALYRSSVARSYHPIPAGSAVAVAAFELKVLLELLAVRDLDVDGLVHLFVLALEAELVGAAADGEVDDGRGVARVLAVDPEARPRKRSDGQVALAARGALDGRLRVGGTRGGHGRGLPRGGRARGGRAV